MHTLTISSTISSVGGNINQSNTRPHPYRRNLRPNFSPLRPHCPAKDRLRLWRPITGRRALDLTGSPLPLSDIDLLRISNVLLAGWAEGTIEVYGSGLLSYHVYCDTKNIPEHQRAPASPVLMTAYLSTLAGFYAGSTVSNYMSGVKAWHTLHGIPWSMNAAEMKTLLKAADTLTPPSSKRKPRPPYTVEIMAKLRPHLDLSLPFDASCWSCLTTLFWSTSRAGEFTVKNLQSFNPTLNIARSAVSNITDRNGLEQTNFKLPRTKSSLHGEDTYWARQNGPTDPESALANHFAVNDPPLDGPLFAYRYRNGHRPLTKPAFVTRLTAAFKAANLDWHQVHGIRIGSTLEYLLRGIPLEVMKSKGRWASDAFTLYLRNHAEIMAPYMQADPALHRDVLRIIIPRTR